MFCYQCGAKLEDGMRFCPSCGEKIFAEGLPTNPNNAESDKPSEILTLTLLGETVQFDETLPLYLAFRLHFEEIASKKAEDFQENFYKSYRDMDQFIRIFPSDFSSLMSEALGEMQSCLSELDIFGVTQDHIQPYMQKYCYHTYAVMQDVQEEYQNIINEQEGMRSYRQAQKAHRGRVVGGGFGLKGAVKGMATASAINMTTGALYSIGNAIGNMGSSISASRAKDKLFHGSLRYQLSTAIAQDILGIHLVAADVITTQSGSQTRMCRFTEEDAEQANKILSDLNASRIPDRNRQAAVIRMLTIYPFSRIYYQAAVQMFPSHLEEIRSFADFFQVDIDEIYYEFRENVDIAVEILWEYKDKINDEILDVVDDDDDLPLSLTTNLVDMLAYFEYIFESSNETGFTFFTDNDPTKKARLSKARQSYANYQNETPLILYDSTVGRNAREGFLITDQHVYISVYKGVRILSLTDALQDIHQGVDPSNKCLYLYFEKNEVFLLRKGDLVEEEILPDFIEFVISLILFLSVCKPTEKNLWKALSQYQALPQPRIQASSTPALPEGDEEEDGGQDPEANFTEPKVCYCFECGAENEADAKYCFECGAELF